MAKKVVKKSAVRIDKRTITGKRNVMPAEFSGMNQGKKYFLGRNMFKFLIFVLVLALVFLVLFLLIEEGILENPFSEYGKVEQKFSVRDECSLIVGNLIHQIDDEGICEARCKTNCQVREMNYIRFEFLEVEGDCNVCDCYCK